MRSLVSPSLPSFFAFQRSFSSQTSRVSLGSPENATRHRSTEILTPQFSFIQALGLCSSNSEAVKMDAVHRELDETKMETQKLKAEYVTKMELYERLREAHCNQHDKFRKVELRLENQDLELNAKFKELSQLRQNYAHVESRLCEKESFLQYLSSVNDDIKASYSEKMQNLEGQNKILMSDLNEATGRIYVLEEKVSSSNEEIKGLMRALLNLDRKHLQAEKKDEAPIELRQREEVIKKLEEDYRGVQDQLKWKNEHFKHLEEAFELVKDQFRSSKEGWEMEKSTLLEEVSTLQSSLYSQTIISEGLKTQLMMGNRALVHDARKKRVPNVQADVGNTQDFEESFSNVDTLNAQKNEVANLRNSFGPKESHSKEMESRITRLEQENQEIRGSLKKLTEEAQVNKAGADSSVLKLQNKLQGMEAVHNKCSMNLKAKETDWSSQLTKTKGDMNDCTFELKGKNKQMLGRQKDGESGMLQRNQLEMKDCALKEALANLDPENENLVSSIMKVQIPMEKLLQSSKRCQFHLEECNLHLDNAHMKDKQEFSMGLETTRCELGEKVRKVTELEIELQNWKSAFEGLNLRFRRSEELRDAQDVAMQTLGLEKESLLQTGKVHERRIGDLQQQIVVLETAVDAKQQLVESVQQEKEKCLQIAQEKDNTIENLCKEIDGLRQEPSMRKEFEEVSKALERGGHLAKIEIQEKNKKIAELEKSVYDLVHALESHEKSLLHSKQEAEKVEASFMKQSKEQTTRELRHLEGLLEKAKVEKKGLVEDILKLTSEREKVLVDFESICDRVGDFSCDDVKMIEMLGEMLHISEEESELKTESIAGDMLKDCTRNSVNASSTVKRPEMPTEKRLPLKDLNH